MTRNEAYLRVLEIVNDSQNEEKLKKYLTSSKEEGVGLLWYLDSLKKTLSKLTTATEVEKKILENSFDASIRHIKQILKEEGIL